MRRCNTIVLQAVTQGRMSHLAEMIELGGAQILGTYAQPEIVRAKVVDR